MSTCSRKLRDFEVQAPWPSVSLPMYHAHTGRYIARATSRSPAIKWNALHTLFPGMNIAAVRKAIPHSLVRAYTISKQKSSTKPASSNVPAMKVSSALFLHQVRLHCLLVNHYVQEQLSHLQRALTSLGRLVEDEWLQCETEYILRERSLWGPEEPWKLAKWMLDMSEGPHRIRKKLVKNNEFFTHYAYREVPVQEAGEVGVPVGKQRVKYPISADSKVYFEEEQQGGRIKTLLRTTKGSAAVVDAMDGMADDDSEPKVIDGRLHSDITELTYLRLSLSVTKVNDWFFGFFLWL